MAAAPTYTDPIPAQPSPAQLLWDYNSKWEEWGFYILRIHLLYQINHPLQKIEFKSESSPEILLPHIRVVGVRMGRSFGICFVFAVT